MHKDILRLAVPNIISNLTVPLLTMVDLHLMGYLNSASFMGAVALGGAIFNIVYWGFGFLRMSTGGLTAQAYGAKKEENSATVLFRGMAIAVCGGILLLILQIPIEKLGFHLLSGSENVKALATNYFYVRIWAAPAAISLMVINGWFLGMQNAKYPMITSIFINIINITASIFFVRIMHLNETGVALGSVIAQYSGLLLSFILFNKKYYKYYSFFRIKEIFDFPKLKHFMSISTDIFIRTACLIFVFTFFTSESASFGDITLASNTALLQFLMLFSYFLDGFAYAAEAITGKFIGAGDRINLIESGKKLMIWGICFALIFTLLYYVSGDNLLLIFTDQKDVIKDAGKYLNWTILLPLVSFASYIWDGIYIGATASKAMRNTAIFATICFFSCFYIFKPSMANNALWLAMTLFMFGRSFSQTILARKYIYSFNK